MTSECPALPASGGGRAAAVPVLRGGAVRAGGGRAHAEPRRARRCRARSRGPRSRSACWSWSRSTGWTRSGLAAAFSISPYEAGQWARRGGYHLHRAAAAADAAAERERLAGHGIAAFTFDEAAVRAAAEPEPALGGRFDGRRCACARPRARPRSRRPACFSS